MTLEQAQTLWRDAQAAALALDDVLREVESAARQFRLRILMRDARELLATTPIVGAFVYIALQPGAPRAAFLIAAVLAAFPMLFLGMHRLVKREPRRPSATTLEHVQRAHREVQSQQWLLERVQWWYLLPLALSAAAVLAGTFIAVPGGPLIGKVTTLVVSIIVLVFVGVLIWRLNLKAAREVMQPRAHYLERLADSLRENANE